MFFAKTVHATKFKALFEILFQNMNSVCFVIDKSGITSENVTNQNMFIKINIPLDAFDEYTFTYDEPQYIGLGSHINQFFKSVKNKSTVTFSITKPYVFDIAINSTVDNYSVKLAANIENMQNIANQTIDIYRSPPVPISGTTFNQICKSFKQPLVNVAKSNGQISFSFEIAGISTKSMTFGAYVADDVDLYFKTFRSDQFTRISKIASFITQPINVFVEPGKPIRIESKSSIGTIDLIINPIAD